MKFDSPESKDDQNDPFGIEQVIQDMENEIRRGRDAIKAGLARVQEQPSEGATVFSSRRHTTIRFSKDGRIETETSHYQNFKS